MANAALRSLAIEQFMRWEIDFGSHAPEEKDRGALDQQIRQALDLFVSEIFLDFERLPDTSLTVKFHPGEGESTRCCLTFKMGPWIELQTERGALRHRQAFQKALSDLKRRLLIEYATALTSLTSPDL